MITGLSVFQPYMLLIKVGAIVLIFGSYTIWVHHKGVASCEAKHAAAALKEQQREAKQGNQAEVKKEQGDAKAKIVYKTITQHVQTYIDRPIYKSVCLDDAGLSDANAALAGKSATPGKPDSAVPGPKPAPGWNWFKRSTEIGGG